MKKGLKEMKCFFFESVGVPGGSPGLGKGNPGWVPSDNLFGFVLHTYSLFRFCVLFDKINIKGFI